jgi:hypothetical protein
LATPDEFQVRADQGHGIGIDRHSAPFSHHFLKSRSILRQGNQSYCYPEALV